MEVDSAILAEGVIAGDRRRLAQAITLLESSNPDHRSAAEDLLHRLLPHTGRSLRVGITGVPGAGKSTFIETLGLELIGRGRRLAVLAIDPSSPRSGGSILGDKTRMEALSRRPEAFIRPSPAGKTLGGVARRTREAMLACEAAGHDVVLVETVGIGQSETAIAAMVDLFVLLLAPAAGDELQGIKKGVVELADLVIVTKADGDTLAAARRAQHDYQAALGLLAATSHGQPVRVLTCSALSGEGVAEAWEILADLHRSMRESGLLAEHRAGQAHDWMWTEVTETLLDTLRRDRLVAGMLARLESEIAEGSLAPAAAARLLVEVFRHES